MDVDAGERAPDVAVLDAGDPGGTAGERDAERVGRANEAWACERAASAGIELAYPRFAHKPDACAADGEIDEIAARGGRGC
jgi:hypothetical protein